MARVVLAMSQEEVKAALPTGSNCREQVDGSATTTTGVFWLAAARAGLAYRVRRWKPGKKLTMAISMPSSITGFRPTLSDSQAKKT